MPDLVLKGEVEALHQQAQESAQEFCIDLEGDSPDGRPVWEWMGYSRKDPAVRSLGKLVEGVDYQSTEVWTAAGGTPRQVILFSREGFKQWGMLANTDRGRQIRLYFIECEKRLQLGMSQPTVLNEKIEKILERQQVLNERQQVFSEDMSCMFIHGFNRVDSRMDAFENRLSRIEEQQPERLYVFVRSKDLTLKLGVTADLEKRRKVHEGRGFRFVGSVPGTRKRESEIKEALRAQGLRPKNGDEEFWMYPEVIKAFREQGLPVGDLCASKPQTGCGRRPRMKSDSRAATPSLF